MLYHFKSYQHTILQKNGFGLNLLTYLDNYFNIHVCLSLHCPSCPVPSCHTSNSCNFITKCHQQSSLLYSQSKKHAFLVTPRPLGSIRQGEAKLCTFLCQARKSPATYIKTHCSLFSLPQSQCQAVVYVNTPRMQPQSRYFAQQQTIKFQSILMLYCMPKVCSFSKNGSFSITTWPDFAISIIPICPIICILLEVILNKFFKKSMK